MSKYTVRRIWAVIVLILTINVAVVAVQKAEEFLNEDFHCAVQEDVIVKSGDAISTIAEEQIVKKNCTGYEPLNNYLVNQYGTELQPGDKIHIPLNG